MGVYNLQPVRLSYNPRLLFIHFTIATPQPMHISKQIELLFIIIDLVNKIETKRQKQ